MIPGRQLKPLLWVPYNFSQQWFLAKTGVWGVIRRGGCTSHATMLHGCRLPGLLDAGHSKAPACLWCRHACDSQLY